MRKDILPGEYKYHDWNLGSDDQSLLDIYMKCEKHADNAISWYLHSRLSKKYCARILRFGAIVLTALAGIIPVLSELHIGQISIQPSWSAVALGLAGLLIGIDHYFGCSTAWMRYIVTEHKIRQHLHEFRLDNEINKAAWDKGELSTEIVKNNLIRCKYFLVLVDQMIRDETEQWIAEFQKTIKQIDDSEKKYSK